MIHIVKHDGFTYCGLQYKPGISAIRMEKKLTTVQRYDVFPHMCKGCLNEQG